MQQMTVLTRESLSSKEPLPESLNLLIDFIADDERPTALLETSTSTSQRSQSRGGRPRFVFVNDSLQDFLSTSVTHASIEGWIEDILQRFSTDHQHQDGHGLAQDLLLEKYWSVRALSDGYVAIALSQHGERTSRDSAQTEGGDDRRQELDDAEQDIHISDASQPIKRPPSNQPQGSHRIPLQRNLSIDANLEELFIDFFDVPGNIVDPWIKSFVLYDWSQNTFGPVEKWPLSLRSAVIQMLHSPEPRIMYWGNEMLTLYNEGAQGVIGVHHPAFGKPLREVFGDPAHNHVKQSSLTTVERGKAAWLPDTPFILDTEGFPRERYFQYHAIPITSDNGRFRGTLTEFRETTAQNAQRNRADALASTANVISSAGSLTDLWRLIPLALTERASHDVVFAIVYALDGTGRIASNANTDSTSSAVPRLEACSGISSQYCDEGLSQRLTKELSGDRKDNQLLLWTVASNTMPTSLAIQSTEQGAVREVAVLTVYNAFHRELAYLVLGINPIRPCEAESQFFLIEMRDLFSRAAAFRDYSEPLQLERQPDVQLDAPIGLVEFAPDGSILDANDAYFELFSSHRCDNVKSTWADAVYPDDVELCRTSLAALASGKATNWTARLNALARAPYTGQRWIESVGTPQKNSKGEVTTITGWVVDVTDRKSLEALMAQRLQDAVEVKKAAERFTDTLSHELRNPLSAILQSADEILSTAGGHSTSIEDSSSKAILEAARTIVLCAQHQKNIVDDVLTLSKLDSDLVVLTPEPVDPIHLLDQARTIFQAQFEAGGITSTTHIHESINKLQIDYLLLDSRRVLQILINLLSNAIKFISLSMKKQVTLELSATYSRPSDTNSDTSFLTSRSKTSMPTTVFPLANQSEQVYLQFSIHDTGLGMSEQEMRRLFKRFAQATAKTYKQYGGTGLGLTISRELAELHGGQIGLRSTPGVGSTFTFYIQAQRTARPVESLSITASSDKITNSDSTVSIKNISILLVEDNAINQKVMARQLKTAGCKAVNVADHGLDALNFLTRTSRHATMQSLAQSPSSSPVVDVILLDVEMPVMDGLTAARRIRDLESEGALKGHVPIIGITANARREQIDSATEAGMDTVVTKPFLIADLVPRIEALVEQWSIGGNGSVIDAK